MADYLTTDTELTSIADAIRSKGGTAAQLEYPSGFISAIEDIETGTDVSDTTATAEDVASGKIFYAADGTRTTGTASGGSSETVEIASYQGRIASYFLPQGGSHSIGFNYSDVFTVPKGSLLVVVSATSKEIISAYPNNYEYDSTYGSKVTAIYCEENCNLKWD